MRAHRFAATVVVSTLAALFWGAPASAATIRRVVPTGTDSGDCAVHACKTIKYAINRSANGDTIQIAAGTYRERFTVAKSVSLIGSGEGSTIIDGSPTGRVIRVGSS